ncbi:tetrahydrofolate synthase [Martiniozyma asiatica (nom. inval.)]|nr:tetrahydrofolate synthase [Martiniozyma asiatica]
MSQEANSSPNMMPRTYKNAIHALNTLQSNFATIDAARKAGQTRNHLLMPEMIEWVRRIGYKPEHFNKLNVIHVTGTKGKGSTCAFVQSILNQYRKPLVSVSSSASVKTLSGSEDDSRSFSTGSLASVTRISKIGLYTSPHLKTVRERIMINGKPISEELFAKYFFEIWDRLESSSSDLSIFPDMGEDIKPAYFRYLTLLSFHTFVSEGIDTAIYEVGVGGEYDSTNVFEHPTACGISALGIDHTFMLGNTIEEIAWNKSGIFKPEAACFSVEQPQSAMKVIQDRFEEKNGGSFEIIKPREDLDEIKLGIDGIFQKQNASLAIALCHAHLTKLGYSIDIADGELSPKFIRGLELAKWAGRCQIIADPKRKEKDNELTWFIDGAHTKESVYNASQWFSTASKTEAQQDNTKILLFNQATRDPEALLKTLYDTVNEANVKFDHVIFTTNVTWSTGDYSDDLVSLNTDNSKVESLEVQTQMAQFWNTLDKKSRKHMFPSIETGVNFIRTLEGKLDVFVCGSLHLVGGFLVVMDAKK